MTCCPVPKTAQVVLAKVKTETLAGEVVTFENYISTDTVSGLLSPCATLAHDHGLFSSKAKLNEFIEVHGSLP